jgi:hypothetical protein
MHNMILWSIPTSADDKLKLNFWTMGFIVSPFLSPFLFGFLAARAKYVPLFSRVFLHN